MGIEKMADMGGRVEVGGFKGGQPEAGSGLWREPPIRRLFHGGNLQVWSGKSVILSFG